MITNSDRFKIRSTVVMLAAALMITGAVTVLARTTTAEAAGSLATTAPVEDEGADCPVTLPGSLTANAKLPDQFATGVFCGLSLSMINSSMVRVGRLLLFSLGWMVPRGM